METKDMKNVNEVMNEETVSITATDIAAGKKEELAKLKKSSHVLGIIAKVVEIVNYVGAALSAVAAVVVLVAPEGTKYFLSSNDPHLFFPSEAWQEIVEALEQLGDVKYALAAGCIASVISCIALALFFRYIRKTFNEMEAGNTPFTEALTGRIKIIGIIVTAIAFFGYGLGEAFVVAAVMLTMYMVFRYGSLLQIESDETI